jgi:hypothetical protein
MVMLQIIILIHLVFILEPYLAGAVVPESTSVAVVMEILEEEEAEEVGNDSLPWCP